MKITEYPQATEFDTGDVLLKDGTNGTKKMLASDLAYALFDGIREMHSQIFRGKNLGSTFTSAQQTAISEGTFHDLWVGDYWEHNGIKYRIVDFDYYPGYLDAANWDSSNKTIPHHVVIMPDMPIVKTKLRVDDNILGVSYPKAEIRSSSVMTSTKNAIYEIFDSTKIMTVYDYFDYGVMFNSGSYFLTDRRHIAALDIELPDAPMILGSVVDIYIPQS